MELVEPNKSEDSSKIPKIGNKNLNLPSISKKGEVKIDYSLVGFATRSLSKKGTLKIQKAKMNLNKTGSKNEALAITQTKN